jgi:PhzF family phenazine biosynthesis protein
MKKYPLYQVDAFAESPFSGNPAAVVILNEWPVADLMQNIAAENNLAETAFILQKNNEFEIRWFTPTVEVELCGHATLASAYVIFNILKWKTDLINFKSLYSGLLKVEKKGDLLILDFPSDNIVETKAPEKLVKGLGPEPRECYKGKTDFLLIFENKAEIEKISPDFQMISDIDCRGIIVSAPGDETDFVSRFFAPMCGINEDPVTGSAHTSLIPYWSKKLGKLKLTAKQISKRKGFLYCEYCGERVKIGGKAILYLSGEILVNVWIS